MSKLLIYIGENQKFNIDQTIEAISAIRGVSNLKLGNFIGAIFECEYSFDGNSTIIRISKDAETLTVEGLGDESLDFALRIQELLLYPLFMIDMDYNFNLKLLDYKSLDELKKAIIS